MIRVWTVCAALMWPTLAFAADKPLYAPPAAWVVPHPIAAAPAPSGLAVQYLLEDTQQHFGDDGDATYVETAAKALEPQGLASLGAIFSIWNPETDTVTIHKLHIVRGGQTIDLLAGGKTFTVLRRETNLELAMLDGSLTATFQPEGLQVGDIIDFAVTIVHKDPVLAGLSQGGGKLIFPGVVASAHFRASWPAAKPMRLRTTDGFGAPTITRGPEGGALAFDLANAKNAPAPVGAPNRYNDVGLIEISQFQDWAQVSSLMSPLYDKASRLAPGSPLLVEVEKIRGASADPKVRAAAALHLVEDQVRYLFLGMNFGGYAPADADLTWSRRFGDCKGKTALLLAILHGLGIEAQPALVSTTEGDGLDQRLPGVSYFDHVMVRAQIGGKAYWLDGTRLGDRGLDDLAIPAFGDVLLIQPTGGHLARVWPEPATKPLFESLLKLDASGGLTQKAPAHVERIFHGDDAIGLRAELDKADASDRDRALREYWRGQLPWIAIDTVQATYDEATGIETLTLDGQATIDWQAVNNGGHEFDVADSSLGWSKSLERDPGPRHDAPYGVDFPMYKVWTVAVKLPRGGRGFRLVGGEDVDQVTGGVEFKRTSTIENGLVSIVDSERSIAWEFPAADAKAVSKTLTDLADHDVDIHADADDSAIEAIEHQSMVSPPKISTDAGVQAYLKFRGRDYAGAITSFDTAVKLNPASKVLIYDRGVAHYELAQDDLAVADFSAALKLDPRDLLAWLARGETYLRKSQLDLAQADFKQALAVATKIDPAKDRIASIYEITGYYGQSIAVDDDLVAAAKTDKETAYYLNDRCWARAEQGQEMEAAQADCDLSLKKVPDNYAALDSRGLVDIRLKHYDAAISDYGAALKLFPNLPTSFYGRALAERALGHAKAADADFEAAKKADPTVAARFKRIGLAQ